MSRLRRTALALDLVGLVAIGLLLSGCSDRTATGPAPVAWTPPTDWTTVTSADAGIQLTLPPWLVAFDTSGAIFANEPPASGEIPMQLMALGPGHDEQPAPGESLGAWIERRLADHGQGVADVATIALPAGQAVRYDRTDRAGTPLAWRIVAFAITTPSGIAYLQFDGPPESWPTRAEDLGHVAQLFRVR